MVKICLEFDGYEYSCNLGLDAVASAYFPRNLDLGYYLSPCRAHV